MSVELLKTLANVSFIAALVMLAISVLLFFVLKIPQVFGELTGRTQRKAIEDMKQINSNETEADNKFDYDKDGVSRTDKLPSAQYEVKQRPSVSNIQGTEALPNNNQNSNGTVVLSEQGNKTTVLNEQSSKTTILNEQVSQTTILTPEFNNNTVSVSNSAYDINNQTGAVSPNMAANVMSNGANSNTNYGLLYELTFMESTEIIA